MKLRVFMNKIVLLPFILMSITGCKQNNPSCFHYDRSIVSDTATCESDGVITYKCNDCGNTWTEVSYHKGHNWKVTSDTSTCLEPGIKTSECQNCHQVKTENVNAKGHSYYSYGICRYCGEFKYSIGFNEEFPMIKAYGYEDYKGNKTTYSKCTIDEISFETQNGYVVAFYHGKKTYDKGGDTGDETVEFQVILKDSENNVITSDRILRTNLVVGQSLGSDGYYGSKLVKESELSTAKTYTLYVNDYYF